MLWIIIAVFMACFLFSMQDADETQERKCHFPRFRRKFDAQTFSKSLRGKTEDELWNLRNQYHERLVASLGTDDYDYYLNCIGVIDNQIYILKHQS